MRHYFFKYIYILVVALGLCLTSSTGCKKLVEVDPPTTSLTSQNVYSDNQTAIATMTSIYGLIAERIPNDPGSIMSISTIAGLSADELSILPNQSDLTLQSFYRNDLNAEMLNPVWDQLYSIANSLTSILEGLDAQPTKEQDAASNLTSGVKKQLLGEAKFMRAFCYFYLVNLYGDVPLQLTTNTVENAKRPRTAAVNVYRQIVIDLRGAKDALSENYLSGNFSVSNTDRIRPNKWAAAALLSRVHIYMKNWSEAEIEATEVINRSSQYKLNELASVFDKNSFETIFQLQPVHTGWNSGFGRVLTLTESGPTTYNEKPFYMNESLVNSFATNDPRKAQWISSVKVFGSEYYYPAKYKKGTTWDESIISVSEMSEYSVVIRLAEQYLIRAEARARQNRLDEALSDINVIRTRARNGNIATVVPDLIGLNQQEVLDAINLERKLELFTEWGDRWLELKRTERIDGVMEQITPLKGGRDWNPNQALFPISRSELLANPNLNQNRGY